MNFNQEKIYIIAELGINHGGNISTALDLIQAAKLAGVHGIKFQYRNLQNAYVGGARQIGDEILLKEIHKNYLPPEAILELVDACHEMKIDAGISFFDVVDLDDFGQELNMFDFFKSPSVELMNTDMINRMLSSGKPVYVSLGCHHEAEIDQAFGGFQSDNWVALHCVSNYPVSLANPKLGYLQHMRDKWQRPFGYSSHDENWEVCLIAMSMGASVIERHITFDKQAEGLDHSTSSTPDEFRRMAHFAQHMPLIMAGNSARVPNQGEMLNLQNLGRSYYAREEIAAGQVITENQLVFRSPRVGLGRADLLGLLGKPAIRRVQAGDVISRSVFVPEVNVTERALDFARSKQIGIPIRLHDLATMEQRFPVGAYEFHLSFGEVLAGLVARKYSGANRYSIHLPDYISSTMLMDPFSPDETQVQGSLEILQRTVDFAKALQELTGNAVPIVGSFSVVHHDLREFYTKHAGLFARYRQQGVSILPQWLPPIAWYFGGSVKLEAMNALQDVAYIEEHELPICMDVCHLCMGDSLYGFDALNMFNRLVPNIHHIHIADAEGIDGEGMAFGEGDPKNMPVIRRALSMDCMKVIEVWQGHLDNGAGFAKALNALSGFFGDGQ